MRCPKFLSKQAHVLQGCCLFSGIEVVSEPMILKDHKSIDHYDATECVCVCFLSHIKTYLYLYKCFKEKFGNPSYVTSIPSYLVNDKICQD